MDRWMGLGWDGSPGGIKYRAPFGAKNIRNKLPIVNSL